MNYIKKAGKNYVVDTPVGDLEYVMITGQGKLNDLKGEYEYTATLVLPSDSDECKKLIEDIQEIWESDRSKKFAKKEPKSLGYRPHRVITGQDEDGDNIYEETGKTAFSFKTQTEFKDGNAKEIKVFNAKGREVALGENKIGNGSRGRINGIVRYYEATSDAGVSLYLNAVQLAKFVAYTGGPNFDEIEEEDAFEGFEDGTEALEEKSDTSEEEAKTEAKSETKKSTGNKPRL